MRLVWIVIPLVFLGIIGVQESDALCVRNTDWQTPCFDQGILPDEKEVREIWHGYYEYKGSAFMEWKKIEMFQAVKNNIFTEWLNDKNNPFVHYNVYRYYLSIGEITNQFPVKRGGYMGGVGVQETPTLIPDISNNTNQSQEKIVITMVPNAGYPPTCDPSIPPYDKPNCFLPAIAHVNIGQPVVFENSKPSVTMIASGNPQHGPDGVFESTPIPPGSSYEISFNKEGVYDYFDLVAPWMQGVIVVGDIENNTPPTINAGMNQIVKEGTQVKLFGIVGDSEKKLKYTWQQISGTPARLSGSSYSGGVSNSQYAIFTAPEIYVTTPLIFQVTVIDNILQRATDTVRITVVNDVTTPSNYPIAIAGDDQIVNAGELIIFDGTKSYDDSGNKLRYLWSVVDSFPNSKSMRFNTSVNSVTTTVAPMFEEDTTLHFQLKVNNGKRTATDSLKVTILANESTHPIIIKDDLFSIPDVVIDDVVITPSHTLSKNCVPNCFNPNPITVKIGTTITFLNMDEDGRQQSHTFTSGVPTDASPIIFNSGLISHGESFSHLFNEPGIYNYYCQVHNKAQGTITVK